MAAKKKPVVAGKRTWPLLLKKTARGQTQTWRIWVEPGPGYVGEIHVRYGLETGKKQHQVETIDAGKNLGRSNETSPFEQAVLQAAALWTRQQERKGYGLTLEASAEATRLAPMLAEPFPEFAAKVDWETAYAQPKLDGHRCVATKERGRVVLRSRKGKPITALPHIVAELDHYLAEGDVVDGEMYCHGMTLQKIAAAVSRKNGVAAHADQIQYHIYDRFAAARFRDRSDSLRTQFGTRLETLVLTPTVVVRSRDDLAVCEAHFLAEGYEGAMLRYGTQGYQAGVRTNTLLKVKQFVDDEFEVIDAREGRSTHRGMCIFICQTAAGHAFEATAPGSHAEKRAYWANHRQYLGRKLTVKYECYSASKDPIPLKPVAKGFFQDDAPQED